MVIFSNCKINLGLNIVAKRVDGYHNLETVFYPIPFYDVVEIITGSAFEFTSSGLPIAANVDNNLCVKAFQLLKKDYPNIPSIHMHLLKNIPMGAGVGGGSANASFTLQLLNQKYGLQISKEKLIHYASQIGSDCAFFMENKPCLATGRGEILKPIDFNLKDYQIVLLFPKVHVSTKVAFENITPKKPIVSIEEIIALPIELWKNKLSNDFEESIFPKFPILQELKNKLYQMGAIYASMSGSGSTIYGIFNATENLNEIMDKEKLTIDYKVFKL